MWKPWLALSLFAACNSSSMITPDATSDGRIDAGFTTCEGACRTTAIAATFGATTRMLDHAYYGVTTATSGATLHVEAYRGGGAGCPTMSSPTTDYTLILGAVPVPSSATPSTSPGNLLDYTGDLLPNGALGAAATSVTITPNAADVCTTCVGMTAPSDPDGMLALDLSLTFTGGNVTGHLFATHCDSLDE